MRAGLSPNAISALESGKRRTPRFATVELLATALALDPQQRTEFMAAARSSAGGAADYDSTGGPPLQSWRSAAELSPLVDRVHEMETIVRSLVAGDTRLLTLTGPAGVGKTRLALAAAIRLAEETSDGDDRFRDGVTLVDLTPIRDPNLVPGAIARTLGLLDIGRRPAIERLKEALGQRKQLVVLDNIEQVLPAAGPPLGDLLVACPGLAFLVTSRAPLQLRWEQTLRVAPLPVPDSTAPLLSLEALLAVPSVALFVGRARARRADFVLREEHAPLLAKIAVQLDGLPLALELAAARMDVLSLSALARRLGDRLQLLASDALDRPERQQSLEAAIGWSYDLLSEPERLLFRCLGVFVGRVSLAASAEVIRMVSTVASAASGGEVRVGSGARAGERTLAHLLSLAQKSLLLPLPLLHALPEDPAELGEPAVLSALNASPGPPGQWGPTETMGLDEDDEEPAFTLLETVREYAWERLTAEGELVAAQRAHARYFLALAERAAPALRGHSQRAWFFQLEREHDNLRAALRWLLNHDGPIDREAGLRLTGALGYFWYLRGYHAEGRRWLEEMLACDDGESGDSTARTRALIAAGPLLLMQSEYARARVVLKKALVLAKGQQDPAAIAEASTYLGHAMVVAGDLGEGPQRLQEAVHRWEVLGNAHGLGETLFYLGYAADVTGDMAAAAAHYTSALQQLGKAGNAQHAGFVQSYLGVLEGKRGELTRAVAQLQAVLQSSVSLRDRWLLSFSAQATVALVGSRAQPAEWARLLGAADALGQATGGATFGWEHFPGAEEMVALREQLAQDGELSRAYSVGRTLPFAKVAALVLHLLEEVARSATPRGESLLTPRERDVLRLVAQGLPSKAIGRELFISERTVAQHLTAIFNKLGTSTRAQAVAVAAQRGLL